MYDKNKSKAQLISELQELREQLKSQQAMAGSDNEHAELTSDLRQSRKELSDSRAETETSNKALAKSRETLRTSKQNLADVHEHYNILGDLIPFGIWTADAKGNVTFLSDVFLKLTGVPLEKFANFDWIDQLTKPKVLETISDWSDSLHKRDIWEGEFTVTSQEDRKYDILIRGVPLLDTEGKIFSWLGINLDISKRKQNEEELRRIKWMLTKKPYSDISRQEKALDQGYGDLTRLNRDGIILTHIGKEFLGNIAKDYLDLLGTSSAVYERNGDYAFGIFASGWCRMMDRASRDLCNTQDNARALKSGKWLCHESCWTDCSKEVIAKGVPVDIECSGGIRLYAEPIFAGEEVIGVINFGYGDPPREPEKLRQLAKTHGLSYDALERESHAHDSRPPYIIEMAKNRLRASARLIGSLVEARLAQEERDKLQSQLLQAQKMESVGLLAGGIAHDFNNALQAMNGNIELLLKGKPDDHADMKRLKAIEKAMNRSAQLVRQLLTFSRKAEPSKQVLDLDQEIIDAARILKRTIPKMITIELYPDQDIYSINADPVQIEQILLNLGLNAADAMPDGGKLIIETKNIILDQEFVRTHQEVKPGEYVLMTVTDTGCGMDKYTLEHVFDPFFTTKEVDKGTGLGLATAYGIVKAHKGHITCDSEPGKGTAFKIYLPATDQIDAAKAEKAPQDNVSLEGTETILMVDDYDDIRELSGEVLEDSGYRVMSAASGEKALEIFKENPREIDLVIMDLNMPGMGGRECTRQMLSIDPSVKVLVASGYSALGHNKEVSDLGAKGFLSKPYQTKELLVRIRKLLDEDQR